MKLSKFAKNKIDNILDLIYPSTIYCINCGKIIDDTRTYKLCNDCMDNFKWIGERNCKKCGKPLSVYNNSDTCYNCKEYTHNFDKGYTCVEYGTLEKNMLFNLKFESKTYIADTIGEIMHDRMHEPYDVVCPIPISKEKLHKRGFNQATLIAKSFAVRTGIHYEPNLIVRKVDTVAMKGLSPSERKINVSGAFVVPEYNLYKVKDAEILIVDDIYTTGATIDEAALTLKKNGAKSVDFISFASGADVL